MRRKLYARLTEISITQSVWFNTRDKCRGQSSKLVARGVPYAVYPIPISNAYPPNTNKILYKLTPHIHTLKKCTFITFEAHTQCFYCVRFGAVV